MAKLSSIILAAGKGTRMKSPLPKVLHPVAGRPMITRVITAVRGIGAQETRVVVGYGEKLIRQMVEPLGVSCSFQAEQLGTAHAVICAEPLALAGDDILIINGDHPLVSTRHLQRAYDEFLASKVEVAVVSATLPDPGQFGRIVRHNGIIKAIVEVKDAAPAALAIKEVNTGIFFVKKDFLEQYLPKIQPNNKQKEFYITDLISLGIEDGRAVAAIKGDTAMAFGVNTQKELALATKALFREKALQLMENGVLVVDPEAVYIEEQVEVGEGSMIYPGCFIKGQTTIGPFTVIEPNVFINDSQIGASVQLRAGSYLEQVKVAEGAIIGPYARLRPQTQIGPQAQVGNFVEMKNVKFGKGSKAAHLTYLGDAEIGDNCNIGCGTITCNYTPDKKKLKTKIGNDVFVGSDTQFIAPVEVGDGAIIASGSTVTDAVPDGGFAIARARQTTKLGYAKKYKD